MREDKREELLWIIECRSNPAWGAATIVRYAALIKELETVAEAAERYLTKNDYDGLFNALRAAGYLGGGE